MFEVMSDEIAATKGEITQAAEAKAHAAVVANARAGGANGALFERPTDEEVEAALKKWRMRRAGATAAADAAKAAAAASARAKLESTASVSGPAAAWAALGDRFHGAGVHRRAVRGAVVVRRRGGNVGHTERVGIFERVGRE